MEGGQGEFIPPSVLMLNLDPKQENHYTEINSSSFTG
jgi:hypothetical protein